MSLRIFIATGTRVLRQVRHDPRTIALLLLVATLALGALTHRMTPSDLPGVPARA